MSKVGDEENSPKTPNVQSYHKDLENSTLKFENALMSYQNASSDEKTHLKTVMDSQLQLIQASIREIQRAGVAKQGEKVATDYNKYLSDGSEENFAALEHDLQTLREYNQLP